MKDPQLKFTLPKGQPAVFRQRELTDDSPFPFGKWKTVPMKNVPSPYLAWFQQQTWSKRWPAVLAYIETHRPEIQNDLKRLEQP